jgi:uncharacterized oligopeptide transporter (OPT) family protein
MGKIAFPISKVEKYEPSEIPGKHPSLFESRTLILGVLFGILGIIIGLELLTRVGITANTSIIGAIIAIAISRIPLTHLYHQKNKNTCLMVFSAILFFNLEDYRFFL